jgi:hypothetical protein
MVPGEFIHVFAFCFSHQSKGIIKASSEDCAVEVSGRHGEHLLWVGSELCSSCGYMAEIHRQGKHRAFENINASEWGSSDGNDISLI